jgi:predicted AAA+ superfamily ATPase
VVKRHLYLDQLCRFIDKPLIKVITGIRRSGKSVMLNLLKDELLYRGVKAESIIHINFDSLEYVTINEAETLFRFVKDKTKAGRRSYLLLDEIQEVSHWEKAVNSFFTDLDADIFITGSNSHLLSSELSTYLAGRYVELKLFTLSYAEYLQFRKELRGLDPGNNRQEFTGYMRSGGFPVLHVSDFGEDTAGKVVYDIYSSIILRDVVQRTGIRDIELLERVIKYLFDNIGNRFSAANIAAYFKSQQRRIDLNTVYNYIDALESAYIIYRIPRFDIKGREILKTLEKCYVGDPGLIHAVMGYRDRSVSGLLENIVMLELRRRGYDVFTGRSEEREVDFIARKGEECIYIQVSFRMESQSTVDREFTPLMEIRDHYPKFVVTMDDIWHDNYEGIRHIHIADFLLADYY